MAIIFDGRKFAGKKEHELKKEVFSLKRKGITPKLVSIIIGDNPASLLYVSLKKKAAERIGATLEIKKFPSKVRYSDLNHCINKLNKDLSVHGIMVQLPLPDNFKSDTQEILNTIVPEKDVDGLRDNSNFVPATVKGILQIISTIGGSASGRKVVIKKVVVIGANGMVGRSLVQLLKNLGYQVTGYDVETADLSAKILTADLLISATGKPGIITGNMIKVGAAIIDVGSPKGDVEFDEAVKKASFITPVPGGVGPVTIVSLLDNLIIACKNSF